MPIAESRLFAVVADVGGTHIRFGALRDRDAPLQCIESVCCADFAGMESALDHYLAALRKETGITADPELLCLALPGDVQSEPVRLVNSGWTVDRAALTSKFDCRLLLLNDFSAQAHALGGLAGGDLDWLREPTAPAEGFNRAIIGPGTGLGAAALTPDGQVLESEAGHVSFAPQSELQQSLLSALWLELPRVSNERLISGPGLANIYRGLALVQGSDTRLTPEQISAGATDGNPACQQAVLEFNRIFGCVCGDLALAFGAKGGVFLSGGLLTALGPLFDRSIFLEQFDYKGRYSDYCSQIPVALVRHPQPGLLGAARVAYLHGN